MNLELVLNPFCLPWFKPFIQRGPGMRIEVVHDKNDLLRICTGIDEMLDLFRPI